MNKMKFVLLALLVCFAGVPLFAQDRNAHIAIFLSQVEVEGDDIGDGFESDFETGSGFGIASDCGAGFSCGAGAGCAAAGGAPPRSAGSKPR